MDPREPATAAVRAWRADVFAPRLCLVTGAPGTGKSRLVAFEVSDAPEAFNAVTTAHGLTADALAWTLAEQLTMPPGTPEGLVAQVSADTRPVRLAVGELDEAGPDCDGAEAPEIVTRLLGPLAELPHVRLLTEGRPEAVAHFQGPSTLLDLDDPRLTDRASFAAMPLDTAAFPNIGLASAMASAGAGDGEVWRRWFEARPEAARPALFALGFAFGPVDATTWRLMTAALTGDPTAAPAVVAAATPLVGRDEPYALPSRPLREVARGAFPDPARVHQAIMMALHASARADWSGAPAYVHRHLLRHARAAGIAQRLLQDVDLLLHADPLAMAAVFDGSMSPGWRAALPWLVSAGVHERPAVVRLAAARRHDAGLAERLAGHTDAGTWRVGWVDRRPAEANPPSWHGPATALALGAEPWDGCVLVAGRYGQLRAVAPDDNAARGRIVADGTGDIRHLAPLPGGAVITLDEHHGVRLIEGRAPQTRADRLSGLLNAAPAQPMDSGTIFTAVKAHTGLTALASGEQVLAAGDLHGDVHAWSLAATAPAAVTDRLHHGPVTAVACVRLSAEVTLVVSGGADGAVRLSSPGREPMGEPVGQWGVPVTAVTIAEVGTKHVFAAAWADGLIRIWDLDTGAGAPLRLGLPVRDMVLTGGGVLVVAGPDITAGVLPRLDRMLASGA